MESRRRNSGILCILFDLDNTLIETRKADARACNKLSQILCDKYGLPQDVAITVCSSYLKKFRKCPDNPGMDLDTWRVLLWSKALGEKYEDIAESVYHQWLTLRYKYLALSSEVKSLLQNLRKHYMIGLITNGPSAAQWEKVEKLNLKSYFDVILVSGDLPWEKPHIKIFHEACDYLGVEPKQCIMVGDKLETDILGGIEAKLGGTVWIPLSSADLDQDDPNPDHIIKNVTELMSLLPEVKKGSSSNNFRSRMSGSLGFGKLSLHDFDDCNSNSSDGS